MRGFDRGGGALSGPLIIGLIIAALVVAGLLVVMLAAWVVRQDERDEMAEAFGDVPSVGEGR